MNSKILLLINTCVIGTISYSVLILVVEITQALCQLPISGEGTKDNMENYSSGMQRNISLKGTVISTSSALECSFMNTIQAYS